MSGTTSNSAEQYSPFEHDATGPPLADHGTRETAAVAAAASVAIAAAVLAVSAPVVAATFGAVVVAAALAGRAVGRRRVDARVEREAAKRRSDETGTTGTVPAAD